MYKDKKLVVSREFCLLKLKSCIPMVRKIKIVLRIFGRLEHYDYLLKFQNTQLFYLPTMINIMEIMTNLEKNNP